MSCCLSCCPCSACILLSRLHQVLNVAQSTVMQDAWARGQEVSVHGWIYAISDGVLQDLSITLSAGEKALEAYKSAVDKIFDAKSSEAAANAG